MGKIYLGQTKLKIQLTTGQDLSAVSVQKIKYKKPDDTPGDWAATVLEATTGVLEYVVNINGTDIDQVGKWVLWAYIEFSDGRKIVGEPVPMEIFKEGT